MYGTLISSVTVGAGGAASIDFTSIPGTYTDLMLVVNGRCTGSTVDGSLYYSFNGLSTSIFTFRELYGASGVVSSGTTSNYQYMAATGGLPGANATSNTFGNIAIYIPNYSGTTNKSISSDHVGENNSGSTYSQFMGIAAGVWANTSAINRITLLAQGAVSNFAQYSTAYLYGLTKGSGGATVS